MKRLFGYKQSTTKVASLPRPCLVMIRYRQKTPSLKTHVNLSPLYKYLIFGPHTSQLRSPAQKVNCDPRHKKHVNRNSNTTMKSTLMPRLKKKRVLIQTPKPCHFRPPQKKQVSSSLHDEIKSSSIPHVQSKSTGQLRPSTKERGKSCPYWKQLVCGPHTKTTSNSTAYTTTKSIDLYTNNKSLSARTKKTCQSRYPQENQVNFDPYIKTNRCLGPHTKNR